MENFKGIYPILSLISFIFKINFRKGFCTLLLFDFYKYIWQENICLKKENYVKVAKNFVLIIILYYIKIVNKSIYKQTF